MVDHTDFLQKIVSETFETATKKVVESMFAERWGWGEQKDVSLALKEAATKMIETDPEVQAAMKARLLDLIKGGQGDARLRRS